MPLAFSAELPLLDPDIDSANVPLATFSDVVALRGPFLYQAGHRIPKQSVAKRGLIRVLCQYEIDSPVLIRRPVYPAHKANIVRPSANTITILYMGRRIRHRQGWR